MVAKLKQWGAYVLLRPFQEWSMHFISGGPNIRTGRNQFGGNSSIGLHPTLKSMYDVSAHTNM